MSDGVGIGLGRGGGGGINVDASSSRGFFAGMESLPVVIFAVVPFAARVPDASGESLASPCISWRGRKKRQESSRVAPVLLFFPPLENEANALAEIDVEKKKHFFFVLHHFFRSKPILSDRSPAASSLFHLFLSSSYSSFLARDGC